MGELNLELIVSVCTGWDVGYRRMLGTNVHVSLRVSLRELDGLCVSFLYPLCIVHLCGKTIGVDRMKGMTDLQRCRQRKKDGIQFRERSDQVSCAELEVPSSTF